MTRLSIEGLARTFPGRPPVEALRGASLEVPEGAIVAVLGPSGCGKTTLLRSIAGLERPDAGTIAIGDRVVDGPGTHVAPERRRIGLVPQEGALFPHLDVGGNLAFGLRSLGRAERRTRVDELLELIGLPGYAKRKPHELSGGQQQRVALGRALAPAPVAVLLDEPFSALDASLRAAIRDEVAATLRRAGTTAVLVTHDQVEALTMADRVAVMRDGEIVQEGSPVDVYRRPVDRWSAEFLGEVVRVPGVLVGSPDRAEVLVRPEQIRPVEGAAGAGSQGAEARVTAVRFRGADAAIGLELAGATFEARWGSTELPTVGSTVQVAVVGAPLPVDP